MARTAVAVAASKRGVAPPVSKAAGNAAALRARQNQSKNEHVQVLEQNPSVLDEDASVNPSDLFNDASVLRDPAVDLRTVDDEASRGPKVRRFRALNEKRVQTQRNGGRTLIVVGKELDELNYNVPLMRSQGLKLLDITDAEPEGEELLDEDA